MATTESAWVNAPTLPLIDQAGVFPGSERDKIEEELRMFRKRFEVQIAVVTISSLRGESIDAVGPQVFRELRLGDAETDNGLLLLLAPSERKARIEVGYGLEDVFTDDWCAQTLRHEVRRSLVEDDYSLAVRSFLEAVQAQKSTQAPNPLAARVDVPSSAKPWNPAQRILGFGLGVVALVVLGVFSWAATLPGAPRAFRPFVSLFFALFSGVALENFWVSIAGFGISFCLLHWVALRRKKEESRRRATGALGTSMLARSRNKSIPSAEPSASSDDSSSSEDSFGGDVSNSGSEDDSGGGGESGGGGASSDY